MTDHALSRPPTTADSARTFLELTRLLNEVEPHHPELTGPLRLTLIRAHRQHGIGWLDAQRFRAVVEDLRRHAGPVEAPHPA